MRSLIKFRRGKYSEQTSDIPRLTTEAEKINIEYKLNEIGPKLSPPNWHRNLATIWFFEQMFLNISWPKKIQILEPACQNFSRLPAIKYYFNKLHIHSKITGIEVDPYVPLKGFVSYWDQAQYYMRLIPEGSQYVGADFFKFNLKSDLIICFYPFVSPEPALAWGLPARFANAESWITSFIRNLKNEGYAFVVHQGDWEQVDFDKAVSKYPALILKKRMVLSCPFFKTKYPAYGSIYQLRDIH